VESAHCVVKLCCSSFDDGSGTQYCMRCSKLCCSLKPIIAQVAIRVLAISVMGHRFGSCVFQNKALQFQHSARHKIVQLVGFLSWTTDCVSFYFCLGREFSPKANMKCISFVASPVLLISIGAAIVYSFVSCSVTAF
jgi:hypothetical protein